jgi:drug/metabolite transporter (DMT)-like permease
MHKDAAPTPDGLTLAAFAVAVTLGAGNFVGVRFSNLELAPFWGAALRFGLAAAIFVVTAAVRRLTWPRGRDLWLTVIYGALSFATFYALMYWALVRVSAGVATVVMAVVPLATVLLAAAQRLERLNLRTAAGALLACAGIVWMVTGPVDLVLPVSALVAMLLAAASVAQAVIVGKRISGNHPAVTNAVGMPVGVVLLLALSGIAGETWALPRQPEVIAAVVYLVTLGSGGLFVLVLLVVRRWTASATSYMFVLFPVVTMVLDAWLTGEPVTAQALTGALVVMAGVWVGALSPAARRRPVTPAHRTTAPTIEPERAPAS